MRRQLGRYGKFIGAFAVLASIAAICGTYIVVKQRLRIPWQDRYLVRAELASAQGLNAGLGQAVNVAGVRVGTIAGADLAEGRGVLNLEIDPQKLPRVYRDARAMLIPNTPLKDMQLELVPGSPQARPLADGGMIPVARTESPIDWDELTGALDADTRAFFETLVSGADHGLRGRGLDVRAVLRALEPTAEQIAQVTGALTARRRELRRLVHNLNVLSGSVATKDRELASAVASASATLQAMASEEAALRTSVARLPGTLARTRDGIEEVGAFASDLAPTLDALGPTVRRLPGALRATAPLLREGEPVLRSKLRPLVREIQPLARDLAPTTRDLNAVAPNLTSAFQVLNYVANELGYNPPGAENEGFLFWLAWFSHNAASLTSTADAHGAAWRGLALLSCSSLEAQPGLGPLLQTVLGSLPACP